MSVYNKATTQVLFDALAHELESNDIPRSNVLGFASDTVIVMVGVCISVLNQFILSRVLCHLAALCAVAVLKKIPILVDNLLIYIFYHFKDFSKTWSGFADILAEFSEIKSLKVLKHCSTQWLSLQHCIRHLLEQ